MPAYYNEHDKFAAKWLRNLIDAGHIAPGVVDERSIEDVKPDDLREFTQCHFFAGIGVWSYALRLAGWSDDRPVWTGSCPCQPFSAAGKGAGFADERHLWPAFHHLISECKPPVVFGEQVASADGLVWLDLVQADLEATGYAFGAADLCAAGVGAPHIRQRLYWVADTTRSGWRKERAHPGRSAAGDRAERLAAGLVDGRDPGRLGDADSTASERRAGSVLGAQTPLDRAGVIYGREHHRLADAGEGMGEWHGPTNGFWRAADWLLCRDGKWRPVEPGTQPLVNGAPARVGRLRAYGNAISPQVAATFISAAMKAQP